MNRAERRAARADMMAVVDTALNDAGASILVIATDAEGYVTAGAKLCNGDLPKIAFAILRDFTKEHGACACPMLDAVETAKAVLEPMLFEVNHA